MGLKCEAILYRFPNNRFNLIPSNIMRTPERVTLMKRYFTVFKAGYPGFTNIIKVALSAIVFGIFIMYAFKNTMIAGLISIAFGISLGIIWIRPFFKGKVIFKDRPTAKQMYNWLLADLNEKVKERACDVLKLNMKDLRSENFLIVPYPIFWNETGVKPELIQRRLTEEGDFIYSVWHVQVIALSKHYISFFNCTYDWVNDTLINEKTNEFFYDDIASVKNDIVKVEKRFVDQDTEDTSKIELTEHIFAITNMSSDSYSVITKIPEMAYSPKLEVNIEKAVQALRITLRQRRYNEEQDPIIMEVERPKDED